MKIIDLSGERFGRLIVLSRAPNNKKTTRWLCLCDCGITKAINATCLTKEITQSCGCLRKEKTGKQFSRHGMTNSSEYSIWCAMKRRCSDKNNRYYHRYGGRGIVVCDNWKDSFENFYKDMGKKPDGYSIDRIDVNGNYSPENCKWSNAVEQANNKSTNNFLTYGDETHTIAEWSRIGGIPQTALHQRIKSGMPMPYAMYNIDYRTINVCSI
jgi:hypothetical protein